MFQTLFFSSTHSPLSFPHSWSVYAPWKTPVSVSVNLAAKVHHTFQNSLQVLWHVSHSLHSSTGYTGNSSSTPIQVVWSMARADQHLADKTLFRPVMTQCWVNVKKYRIHQHCPSRSPPVSDTATLVTKNAWQMTNDWSHKNKDKMQSPCQATLTSLKLS